MTTSPKTFTLQLSETSIQQMMEVIDFAIRSSGLQQERICRLGLSIMDTIRAEAKEVPES